MIFAQLDVRHLPIMCGKESHESGGTAKLTSWGRKQISIVMTPHGVRRPAMSLWDT